MNGPDPTIGSPSEGSLAYCLSPSFGTSFQMCSGMIGIGISGRVALGVLSERTTVASSGADTPATVLM